MKRLLFIAATLLLALSAKAEVRGYGGLTLDFTRAKKTGKIQCIALDCTTARQR